MKKIFSAICLGVMLAAAMPADSTIQGGQDTRLANLAMQGDRAGVLALLRQKVNVNAPQGDGMTALHWAAMKNDLALTEALLAAGADVKATTRVEALTPLLVASNNGNATAVPTPRRKRRRFSSQRCERTLLMGSSRGGGRSSWPGE